MGCGPSRRLCTVQSSSLIPSDHFREIYCLIVSTHTQHRQSCGYNPATDYPTTTGPRAQFDRCSHLQDHWTVSILLSSRLDTILYWLGTALVHHSAVAKCVGRVYSSSPQEARIRGLWECKENIVRNDCTRVANWETDLFTIDLRETSHARHVNQLNE